MKRIWKRAAALLMTMAMVLAMALPTQASSGVSLEVNNTTKIVTTTETVTISSIPADAESLSFATYQVLYATYDSSKNELEYHLTDWAKDALVAESGKLFTSETDAIDGIMALVSSTMGTDKTEQNEIVNALAAYVADTTNSVDVYISASSWTYTASNATANATLPVGSYLVIPSAENMAFLNMLLSVSATGNDDNKTWDVTGGTAVLKGNKVTLTKTVKEAGSTEASDESTDAQIGEDVTYTITVNVPRFASNISNSAITFKIVDEPENVAIKTNSIKVCGVDSNNEPTELDLNDDYTFNLDSQTGKLTIDLSVNYSSIFNRNGTYPYTTVQVTYNAEVTSDAIVTSANENTATLYYGHDLTSESDANTTEGSADVYTYKAVLTKRDATDDTVTLSGAVFQITDESNTVISFVKDSSTYTVADSDADPTEITTELTTGSDGTLTIIGLDSGKTYTIEEITAPSGYSINSNVVEFTIEATSPLDGTIEDVDSKEYTDNTKQDPATTTTWTVNISSGNDAQIELTQTDTKLSALPATGSVGIIVFTIAGVAIMILALVLINSGKSKAKKA